MNTKPKTEIKDLIIDKLGKRFIELKKHENTSSTLMAYRTLGAIEAYRNTLKYLGGINDSQANKLRDSLPVSIETDKYTIRNLELDIRYINNN